MLLPLLLPVWCVQASCAVISALSRCHSMCVYVCALKFSDTANGNVSLSSVRLLARCLSHAMAVSLWECSLMKEEFFWVKVVKRKKLTKKTCT